MIVLKAPDRTIYDKAALDSKLCVFMAGTIEMGNSKDWQAEAAEYLQDVNGYIFNPRRDDWNSNWFQDIGNEKFVEQVTWELDAMDRAHFIVMHFEPGSKSPITLLELGLYAARNPDKLIVHCPEGFWRKGNVDIVCNRYNVPIVVDIKDALSYIKTMAKTCKFGDIP